MLALTDLRVPQNLERQRKQKASAHLPLPSGANPTFPPRRLLHDEIVQSVNENAEEAKSILKQELYTNAQLCKRDFLEMLNSLAQTNAPLHTELIGICINLWAKTSAPGVNVEALISAAQIDRYDTTHSTRALSTALKEIKDTAPVTGIQLDCHVDQNYVKRLLEDFVRVGLASKIRDSDGVLHYRTINTPEVNAFLKSYDEENNITKKTPSTASTCATSATISLPCFDSKLIEFLDSTPALGSFSDINSTLTYRGLLNLVGNGTTFLALSERSELYADGQSGFHYQATIFLNTVLSQLTENGLVNSKDELQANSKLTRIYFQSPLAIAVLKNRLAD